MQKINIIIRGESELVLLNLLNKFDNKQDIYDEEGIAYKKDNEVILTKRQNIISDLDILITIDCLLSFLRTLESKIPLVSLYKGIVTKSMSEFSIR